jgi:hypothetical protein
MTMFRLGRTVLSSGAVSEFKIEYDAATDDDVACHAWMIRQLVGPFRSVHGVPRGGLRLEKALTPYCGDSGPALVVDDVLTTGRSLLAFGGSLGLGQWAGAVAYARGRCPVGVSALFQMPDLPQFNPAGAR